MDKLLQAPVLHDGFKVLRNLVFVAGVGVHHIPARLGVSILCHLSKPRFLL